MPLNAGRKAWILPCKFVRSLCGFLSKRRTGAEMSFTKINRKELVRSFIHSSNRLWKSSSNQTEVRLAFMEHGLR